MSLVSVFNYECRSAAIPKSNWEKIRRAAEQLFDIVQSSTGDHGTWLCCAQNDEDAISYEVGDERFTVYRVWSKSQYGSPDSPELLRLNPVGDLFIRSVLLAVAHYAPKKTAFELRSSGSVSGWKEAARLLAPAIVGEFNLWGMIADMRLGKGFDNPMPANGDDHLLHLAAVVLNTHAFAVREQDEQLQAPISGIPFPSRSWFF